MSRRKRVLWGTMVLASASAVVPAGSTAWAGTTPTDPSLATIQAKAATAVSKRVSALNAAVSRVETDRRIGPGATTLTAYLQKDVPALQQLGQKIADDTTAAAAAADARTILTDYRVRVLVLPAARLAAIADRIGNTTVARLTTAATRAATYENAGNEATVAPLLSDLNGLIRSITSSTAGVASAALAYTPAEWNADHAVLAASKSAVRAARSDVQKARSDLRQIRGAVRASH